jgi:hypothetical protein
LPSLPSVKPAAVISVVVFRSKNQAVVLPLRASPVDETFHAGGALPEGRNEAY